MFYTDTISGQGFFLPIAKSERLADLTTIRVAVVSAVLCEMCVAILFFWGGFCFVMTPIWLCFSTAQTFYTPHDYSRYIIW